MNNQADFDQISCALFEYVLFDLVLKYQILIQNLRLLLH